MSMGVNFNSQGSEHGAMSDINVTPMVDIMLVLLVIFMVTAPLLTQGVDVNLPTTNASPLQSKREPLVITVAQDGTTYIEKNPQTSTQLIEKVSEIRKGNPDLPIFVRGDRKTPYGAVMIVMSQLQQAGVDKVGLVTEPPAQ
ncbi:protein TolR [Candidatus Magnetaquicoccus inordinatus]|uniref:protein TolR n=1 Tax=Candidatus Magnetaquicoccus inordinatus TaxID=2496818 RepID=UPI001D0ED52B|nr:protein TolR [Candidatus Magnetaquicoccus inordinatus]